MNKQKTIKAWAITTKKDVIIDCSEDLGVSLIIFTTRKTGNLYLKSIEMEKEWRIQRCEIKILNKK